MRVAAVGQWARVCAVLFLIGAPRLAQAGVAQAPLTVQDLLDLDALGYSEAEIRAEVERTGTKLALSAEDRARLEGAGFGPGLIALIAKAQPAPVGEPAPVTGGLAADPPPLSRQIVLVYSAPASLVAEAATWTQLAAEAVFIASRAAGGQRVVTSGTLTQVAPGRLEFQHSPAPADRLHVAMKDGTTADYHVTAFQGDLSTDGATFLNGAHDFAVRVVVPGKLDLALTSRRARSSPIAFDGTADSSARGTMAFGTNMGRVEVRATGTYYFETGFGGVESRSDLRTLGTIEVEGASLRLDERWQANLISTTKRRVTGTGEVQQFASSYVRTVNSTWTAGKLEGALRNGVVRTAFADGRPSSSDDRFWKASGDVVVDGKVVGSLSIVAGIQQVRLVVTTTPEPVTLQTWTLPAGK